MPGVLMIEEQGRVVAVQDGSVWVETVRTTACDSCSANKGCGHAVLDRQQAGARARIEVLLDGRVTPSLGDHVVIGIPEGALMRGALMVYLLPLVALFLGALAGAGQQLAGVDLSLAGGLLGLLVGFLGNRWYSVRNARNPAIQPQLLRVCIGN